MRIAREHDEEVFIVLARNHRVEPVDASGKKGHPLILDRSAVKSKHTKILKIPRFPYMGKIVASVVGGIGGVVERHFVVIDEHGQAGDVKCIVWKKGKVRKYSTKLADDGSSE